MSLLRLDEPGRVSLGVNDVLSTRGLSCYSWSQAAHCFSTQVLE